VTGPVDHFTAVPRRFTDAHIADELDALHVLIGLHVAARCYEVRNTSGGVAAIRLSSLAELCERHPQTIRLRLESLKERGWIGFEKPKPGQHTAWKIWLTGLEVDFGNAGRAANQLNASSTRTTPPTLSTSSTAPGSGMGAIPLGERDNSPPPPQHVSSTPTTNETRREEKRTTKSKPLSEEKLDHVLGEGTSGETDRSLAACHKVNAHPPARVEVDEDGSLRWNREPQEGEQSFLDDCQALVDVGIASWLKGPA